MKINLVYKVVLSALALAVGFFIIFPFEALKTKVPQTLSIRAVNTAITLTEWQWNRDLKYSCSNISLLGHKTPAVVVIPTYVDGKLENSSEALSNERTIFIEHFDVITKGLNAYFNKAAEFNKLVLDECGFVQFLPKKL